MFGNWSAPYTTLLQSKPSKSTLSGFFEISGGGLMRLSELMKPRPFPVDKKVLVLEGAGTKFYLRRHAQPAFSL